MLIHKQVYSIRECVASLVSLFHQELRGAFSCPLRIYFMFELEPCDLAWFFLKTI